jgi:hypothetical protein
MPHASISSKFPILVAAAIVAAAGLALAPPGHAAPGCAQYGFDGPVELGGSNGWWVNFTSDGSKATGSATVSFVDGGRVNGTIISGGVQGRTVDLSIVWGDKPNNIWDFHGTVGDDGHVRDGGQSLRNIPADYSGEVASSWSSVTSFKCLDAPAQTAPDPSQAAPPPPPPPVICPKGSPAQQVPAGQTCPAPANAIAVTFSRAPIQWTVNVTNSADIGGNCSYVATANNGSPGASKSFTIDPKGTTSFTVPAPAPFTTYRVVTSCTGLYDGQNIEFGRVEQDVSL